MQQGLKTSLENWQSFVAGWNRFIDNKVPHVPSSSVSGRHAPSDLHVVDWFIQEGHLPHLPLHWFTQLSICSRLRSK